MRTIRIACAAGILFAWFAAGLAGAAPAPQPGSAAAPQGARGTRTLYLVRHGLYDDTDPRDELTGKGLVPVGREQAKAVASRLAGLPAHIDAIYSSDFTRARQTAAIIAAALPGREPRIFADLRECTPPTPRQDIMKTLRAGEADECVGQLEGTFAHYFRPTSGADSAEVLVSHGSAIRYLVCRSLGVDAKAWLNMNIQNCGLTVIQVRADGTTRLVSFNDVGHLPAELQTSSMMRPDTTKKK